MNPKTDILHLDIPDGRRLSFYLAAEEWAARTLPTGSRGFMAWRVEPSVICGRHQDIAAEVDINFCRSRGIGIFRRRSGGGCVYADRNNVMMSFVTAVLAPDEAFGAYTAAVSAMLGSLGIDATVSGRNDITVGGAKIAGNAYMKLGDRAVIHGTMLVDVDTATMSQAITPSREKLRAKGVRSVEARVSCLKALGLKMDADELSRYAAAYICSDRQKLTTDDLEAIEAIERSYLDPDFLRFGSSRKRSVSRRIDGVGEFSVDIQLDSEGRIAALDIKGDFFDIDEMEALTAPLTGIAANSESITKAVSEIDTESIVAGLKRQQFTELLILSIPIP